MATPITLDHFERTRLDLFWRFVCERHTIWTKRVLQKLPPPWTDDPILRAERFTNIYRELDPGTQYAITAILEREAPKADKIFNIMLYRLIGRAETHATIGFQHVADFRPDHLRDTLHHIRDHEGKAPFTAAYMVSGYTAMGTHDKAENIARLFQQIHHTFPRFTAQLTGSASAEAAFTVLRAAPGFGNFLAYQVLVDLLYPLDRYQGAGVLPFSHNDWAKAGPGAQRGIRMVLRQEAGAVNELDVMRWLQTQQQSEFTRLGLAFPYLVDAHTQAPIPISLANIQNCLCEFHKYVKIGEGTGKGRRKFAQVAAGEPHQLQLTFGEGV
jgi:hypothetical protein